MKGLIGKKIGMTSVYNEFGANIACTVVEVSPNAVTQIKSDDTDGYNSVQIAFDDAKEKNTSKPMKGHFAKAGVQPKRKIVEVRDFPLEKSLGEEVKMTELFQEGEKINVVGTSKGKGFQGVVKRHGFGGVGQSTHGQHNRLRAPGSIGAASYPSKVIKGLRMAGQTGNKRVKVKNVSIVKMFEEQNIILLKGAVPGHKGSYIILEK